MKTSKTLNILIVICSFLFFQCAKKGKDGEPGKDGSANVKARTFTANSWTDGSSFWWQQFSVPELTADNINSAAVQVYWSTTPNNWLALPYTYVASTNYYMNYLYTVNLVEVRWEYNGIGTGSSPNSVLGSNLQIKVVVIPPALLKKDIDIKNYNEVKKAYGLN